MQCEDTAKALSTVLSQGEQPKPVSVLRHDQRLTAPGAGEAGEVQGS